jgi:hypothetical protein
MDPLGLLGVVGYHFFFLAPLLHVCWNYWLPTTDTPVEWRDWLGGMGIANAAGIVCYRAIAARCLIRSRNTRAVWKFSKRRFRNLALILLAITATAQAAVYASFGGVSGYIDTYRRHPESFQGTGWLFVVSESFPILAIMAFAVWARSRNLRWTTQRTASVLFFFFILLLIFGGLRGSRSNTVWALVWAAGIIHLWIRRISRGAVYVGLVCLIAFMYVYGFYKELNGKSESISQTIALGKKRGRTLPAALLGDLGRADIQAFILYRLVSGDNDYELKWGATYVGAIALLIPRVVWPERPPTAVKAGTEIQHYGGSYAPGQFESSKVYGLAGETMLNFGPLAIPVAFAGFGLFVWSIRRFMATADALDSRLLVMPFLAELCLGILVGDSGPTVWVSVKQALVPSLFILCASKQTSCSTVGRLS